MLHKKLLNPGEEDENEGGGMGVGADGEDMVIKKPQPKREFGKP